MTPVKSTEVSIGWPVTCLSVPRLVVRRDPWEGWAPPCLPGWWRRDSGVMELGRIHAAHGAMSKGDSATGLSARRLWGFCPHGGADVASSPFLSRTARRGSGGLSSLGRDWRKPRVSAGTNLCPVWPWLFTVSSCRRHRRALAMNPGALWRGKSVGPNRPGVSGAGLQVSRTPGAVSGSG